MSDLPAPPRLVRPDPNYRWVERPTGPEVIAGRARFGAYLRTMRAGLAPPPGRRRVRRDLLADKAGLGASFYTELELGKKSPREPTVRRLAAAFASFGAGDSEVLFTTMLDVLGPALAEPSRDPARVEWHRSKRPVRIARRQKKQAMIEAEARRVIFPLAATVARVHAAHRLEIARDSRRIDERLQRLRQDVRDVERRPPPDAYPDGAPMGTGSRELRRWQQDLIAECEERFGRRRLDQEVALARKRAEADAETAELHRRYQVAVEQLDSRRREAERREAEHEERFAAAADLLESGGAPHGPAEAPRDLEPVPTAEIAPAPIQAPLTGNVDERPRCVRDGCDRPAERGGRFCPEHHW